ncbi:MAG TPA: alkaline phosphatase family protein [Gaiellaceae bacterium]
MANAAAPDRLAKIKHIVVLMMENRSFDHMLGYLGLDGVDVEGLQNAGTNDDADGNTYAVHEFSEDQTAFHLPGNPFDKTLDPCHGPDCVAEQMAGGTMSGFVKNFVSEKNPPAEFFDLPMGHFSDKHVPVYDHLARTYSVCDHWHSSIPGDTWPNRLYSLAGEKSLPVARKLSIFADIVGTKLFDKFKNTPIFEVEAFTRQLRNEQWRWYSHDPATLRAADGRYRDFTRVGRGNFAYFDKREIGLDLSLAEALFVGGSFLDDVTNRKLRDVSWIDPNFIDLRVGDQSSNDDHPPADITDGQILVLNLYEALLRYAEWNDTLLVITYDEHGGFYDHVAPPAVDDGSGFPTYGVRVPAIAIGPRVQAQPCHELFDHTSLIKTILLRFADDPDKALNNMPPRVRNANDLSVLLLDQPQKRQIPDLGAIRGSLAQRRAQAHAVRADALAKGAPPQDASTFSEFEQEFAKFAIAMRKAGLRPGHP